jgi:hypothetical protein
LRCADPIVLSTKVEISRIVRCITRSYVPVYTATEQYKVVWYYSIVCTNVALCQLSTYLLVLGIPKLYKYVPPYTRSEPGIYLVCTRYVLLRTCTYSEKQTKRKRKTSRFELWISCIASCALYHYITSVHSMVISWVNTWYITPETYTCGARYLLAGVGRLARVQPRPLLRP